MSVRHFADHITTETNTEVRVDIIDSDFVGDATKLKGTGSGWLSDNLQKLDVRNPVSNPIQRRTVSASVWMRSSSLIDDLFGSQEGRFKLVYKIAGTQEWEGYILPDLCSYKQLENNLYQVTVVARDFSVFEGSNFTLEDNRKHPINIIADILSDKFSLPIHTYTSWIVNGTTTTNDFLREIYFDTVQLREYARTGNETDQPITTLSALETVLKSCGAIIRQINGKFYIQQVTALSNPASVFQTIYNSAGVFQSAGNIDLTKTAKVVIDSTFNVNPGVKSARVRFNHQANVSQLQIPPNVYITGAGSETYSRTFITTGEQTIKLSCNVRAFSSEDLVSGTANVRVRVGQYYWTGSAWSLTDTSITVSLSGLGVTDDAGNYYYEGNLSINTTDVPADANSPLEIIFYSAVVGSTVIVETRYENISFDIVSPGNDSANSAFIDYQLTQTPVQSVRVDYGETVYGDGPTDGASSAIRKTTATNSITSGDWARRGEATYLNHHHNLLREILDSQRTSRIRLSGVIKTHVNYLDVINFDSKSFYNLGGSFDGYTGVMNPEVAQISITSESDTFSTVLRFAADGSVTQAGSSGSSGISETNADARYFRQTNNLSEGAVDSMLGNLSLVTELKGLTGAEVTQLGNIDTTTISTTQWGYLGALDQNLRTTDTVVFGKVESAGDVIAYRNGAGQSIQEANYTTNVLTANEFKFSGGSTTEDVFVQVDGEWVVNPDLLEEAGVTTLAGLSDVNVSVKSDNDVLTYNSSSDKWEAMAAQGGGSVNEAADYTWTGDHTFTGTPVFGTLRVTTLSKQNSASGTSFYIEDNNGARRVRVHYNAISLFSPTVHIGANSNSNTGRALEVVGTARLKSGTLITDASGTSNFQTPNTGGMWLAAELRFGNASSSNNFINSQYAPMIYGSKSGGSGGFGSSSLIIQAGGTGSNRHIFIRTSNQTRMFVSNNGNVGIGTTSPNYDLDVNADSGGVRIYGSSNDSTLRVRNIGHTPEGTSAYILGQSGNRIVRFRDNVFSVYNTLNVNSNTTSTAHEFRVHGGGSEAIFDGNVGIGTTSPGMPLHIRGAGGNSLGDGSLLIQASGTTSSGIEIGSQSGSGFIQAGTGYPSGNVGRPLYLNPSGGNVGIGTTSPTEKLETNGISKATNHVGGSDRRIKSNFQQLSGLEIIRKAGNLYSYEKEGIEGREVGQIAQDLLFCDDLVHKSPHEKLGEMYSLSGLSLAGVAMNGVKELDLEHRETKSEVDILKDRVQELEQEVETLRRDS